MAIRFRGPKNAMSKEVFGSIVPLSWAWAMSTGKGLLSLLPRCRLLTHALFFEVESSNSLVGSSARYECNFTHAQPRRGAPLGP
jgi:hypothetical protein